jgi:hypothetical protein
VLGSVEKKIVDLPLKSCLMELKDAFFWTSPILAKKGAAVFRYIPFIGSLRRKG